MAKPVSQSVTSTTIAQRLGLSRATVSYVINGQAKERKISEETVRRVLEMAEELRYVPNELARSLRLQQTGVIGLVSRGLGYNWIERILVGMLPIFDRESSTPFLSMSYWDAAREQRELESLLQRRVDGIICVPMPYNIEMYRQIMRRGIPFVFLGDALEGLPKASHVVWDSGRATRVALEHLIQTGRRRIGFIGADHQTLWTKIRLQTYRQTMREHGLKVREAWIAWELFDFSYHAREGIEAMVDKVLPAGGDWPDALFVSSDALAMIILDILHARGIRVPEDVAVIGLGDLFMSDHSGISLSTVREPTEELGRQAAEAVFELIKKPEQGPIQKIIQCDELFVRRTTQPNGSEESISLK